jgi:molybdopterin/thiamine biosynthesis adenylyltransferase
MTWTNPAPMIYGAALTSTQLNAAANVSGSFAYNPINGTVLNAGTNTLSVIFTPTDTVDYSSATNTVSLVVSQAPLTVTAANTSRLYAAANPVFTGTIRVLTNGDNITAAYSCSATASSPAGTYSIVPSLVDPNNRQTNYTVSLVSGTLTVGQATPIMTWTNPAPIIYGAALTSTQLNATANVPGRFAYNPTNGAALNAGTNGLSVIFTPTDTVDYSSATNTVGLVVSQASLTVTAANASRLYGAANPVFTGTITGLTNGDNITAAYSCSATTSSPVGTYSIVPSLVDLNNRQTNYTVSLVSGTLTVGQATPIITWTNPAPIIYGAALTSTQLNATANVPGSFAYNPTYGTVLNSGTNILSVIFTPSDTVDYSSATNTVSLVINFIPTYLLHIDVSNISSAGAQLTMSAIPGQVYEVQASTNLVDWVNLKTVTADSSGIIQVLDTSAKDCPQRFYRAMTQ